MENLTNFEIHGTNRHLPLLRIDTVGYLFQLLCISTNVINI